MALRRFLDLYESRTKKSKALWEKAKKVLPGGLSGRAGYREPYPIYVDKAVGGKLIDVDGNEYIDLVLGGFPNILGHSPKPVVEAVKRQVENGTCPGLFNEFGVKLAGKIQQFNPHMERVRFVNTGSEATMSAIRVARAWTGKGKIAKPEGGYSGQHDYVLISGMSGQTSGSDQRPVPVPDCAGVPKFVVDNTIIFPWNDIEATVSIIKEHANELAAVILEPVQGFGMGAVPADKKYLEAIRKITAAENIVLIFDEIVTGFRIEDIRGAVKYYGVIPDLACYGKIIGGGLPVGAYGGREDIMERTCNPVADPKYRIFQSGTFTGNPLTMSAGLACLTELEAKDYSYINSLAEKFRGGLSKALTNRGFEAQVTGISSVFYLHFNNQPVRSMRDKLRDDLNKSREFSLGMIAMGVNFSALHTGATCFAHTAKDIDTILGVVEEVLIEMKQ